MSVKNKIFLPTLISSITYQPVRTLPHIYFYNGLKDCEDYYIQHYPSGSTASIDTSLQTQFPYLDYYDGLTPNTGSNSLLFFNEIPPYGETPTGSLYTEYWDTYVSLLYNPRTRLVNASAIIPLADYFEMELNDIVQWRGNYYHLRAINDYNLKDGTCNIQLLGPIIKDASDASVEVNCEFGFSSSFEPNPPTTTTTTAGPTTTSTTTTTAAPNCLSASMQGAASGSFISGGIQYEFISWFHDSGSSQSKTLNVFSGTTTDAKLLLIGGGGAGGYDNNAGKDAGGGGGAGEVLFVNNLTLSSGSYAVTVGRGGIAPTSGLQGGDGTNSVFLTYTAGFGAGGGGSFPNNSGRNAGGGSGGGIGESSGTAGTGTQSNGGGGANGGGGGATGNGSNGGSTGGNGGPGITFNGLIGTALSVGGGGGGSGTTANGTATDGGGTAGNGGTDGTGGGGGGATSETPGKGGNGRFILTYRSCTQPTPTTTTGAPTTTEAPTTTTTTQGCTEYFVNVYSGVFQFDYTDCDGITRTRTSGSRPFCAIPGSIRNGNCIIGNCLNLVIQDNGPCTITTTTTTTAAPTTTTTTNGIP